MLTWVQKILVSLAVLTVLGHGMFTHHHSDDVNIALHYSQHDHDDDHDIDHHRDHNPFSFKYLDHVYHSTVSFPEAHKTIITFILDESNYSLVPVQRTEPCQFVLRNEHPPPLPSTNTISLRGPPESC